jgi:membrane-associated phospholipid phosphatase
MSDLIRQNDATALAQVTYWDAGAPAYRWMDLINARANANLSLSPYPVRLYTYVALAMYDATVSTWESKYYYQRRRPSEFNRLIPTAVDVPNSPSYPSEHASTAWAAATVLSYFFPTEASTFQALADQAGWSRVLAGVQYPSDVDAGKALGIAVAQAVIAKSQTDGSANAWAGTVPTGPCRWYSLTMTAPGNASGATWSPLLLTSPGQFRPPAPPACTSPQMIAETAVVKNFPRTFITNYKAFTGRVPKA